MKVGKLKKILAELPDDARVIIKEHDGQTGDIYKTTVCSYALSCEKPDYTVFDDEPGSEADPFDKLKTPVLLLESSNNVERFEAE